MISLRLHGSGRPELVFVGVRRSMRAGMHVVSPPVDALAATLLQVAMTRLNVRLRQKLFSSLMQQARQ